MRAVKGSVVSSRPVSLSKAAAILARFAAAENGARPETAAYLRRASTAFDELVQFHREIKAARRNERAPVDGGDLMVDERAHGGGDEFELEERRNEKGNKKKKRKRGAEEEKKNNFERKEEQVDEERHGKKKKKRKKNKEKGGEKGKEFE